MVVRVDVHHVVDKGGAEEEDLPVSKPEGEEEETVGVEHVVAAEVPVHRREDLGGHDDTPRTELLILGLGLERSEEALAREDIVLGGEVAEHLTGLGGGGRMVFG